MKKSTSLWLSDEAKELLKAIADCDGVSQSAILEQLIRREYRRRKAEIEASADDKS